jgi:CheY-like chemotaxis protein
VALTGWGREEDRMRTQAAGIDLHWVKPVDPHALRRILALEPAKRA